MGVGGGTGYELYGIFKFLYIETVRLFYVNLASVLCVMLNTLLVVDAI